MSTNICPECGKTICDPHGNRLCHAPCAYNKKKARSKRVYAENMLKINRTWRNEKILRPLYYQYGENFEIDPQILVAAGFDFNINSGKKMVGAVWVLIMNKFGFSILKNQKIILWKI